MDVTRQIGAVAREIAGREQGGATARVLVATRRYEVDAAVLWDLLTNAQRIPRWFLPISGELRPGGRYQLEGNAGGEILRCEPPRRLAVTWEMHGQASWVDVQLSPAPDGGTLLRLEHAAHVPDEFWQQFGPGAVGVGWDQALLGLDRHLATGEAVDPADAMAWLSSDEGRAFVRESSEAWGTASIAAGAESTAARAAAERTTAFYTS
jgi:uncharacterized protein YndB with AHSA1/START domain